MVSTACLPGTHDGHLEPCTLQPGPSLSLSAHDLSHDHRRATPAKATDHSFEIFGSNGGVAEDMRLLGCDAVSLGEHFLKFQEILDSDN